MSIYTDAEFAAFLQTPLDDLNVDTLELLRDLVTGLIDEVATFEDEVYPITVKAIALKAAARAYLNPQGLTSVTAGGYTERRESENDTGVYLSAAEKATIVAVAGSGSASGAWAIDTVSTTVTHADICAVNFGAVYCSCGALLTGSYPLYELG